MSEVAWIFGNSAVGKETFIKKMLANEAGPITESLGWAGLVLAAASSSIDYIGQFDGDPITVNRDKILTEVPELLSYAEVALIKWQGVDSGEHRVEQLQHRLPEATHRIIQLVAPDEELMSRLQQKSWWIDDCDIEDIVADELITVEGCIDSLKSILPVTKISSSVSNPYQSTPLLLMEK